MAGIKLTNLNYNLDGPSDKAVKGGKPTAGFFTGPTRSAQNFQQPNPLVTEYIKNNPKIESFYKMPFTQEAEQAQFEIDNRVGFYGNTFEGQNNNQAQIFLSKYYSTLGGDNTAEGKGLIEPDRIVRPENLAQLSSQPAAGVSGVQDPNVAGKFPTNSVAVS
tara:strand:- start:649 stop:1134 length:486 start_codon:yes stop_codon:yes gene_type:complete